MFNTVLKVIRQMSVIPQIVNTKNVYAIHGAFYSLLVEAKFGFYLTADCAIFLQKEHAGIVVAGHSMLEGHYSHCIVLVNQESNY